MSESIKVLNQSEIFGKQFTMYGTAAEPLFVAKDVAEWIGHTNPTSMIKTVEDDEKLNSTIFSAGQHREVSLLTENGLYEVLFQSRKEKAKQFKKAVKSILTQIRTTGGYIPVESEDDDKTILAKAVTILQRTLDLKENEIKVLQPKAELCDQVINSDGYVDFNTVAKSLNAGIGRNKLMEFLRQKKVLFKNGRNSLAYQKFCNKGYFKINYGVGMDGLIHGVTKVSPQGISYIYNLLKRENFSSANSEVAQ